MTEINWEERERAEELYIIDGLSLEQTARETGISIQSLKKWSADEGWPEQRKEYRQALGDISRKTVLLRKKLIDKAFDSLDPQDVYAAVRVEKITKRQGRKDDEQIQIDRPALFLEALEFIAENLQGRDPEGLKVLARNFDSLVGTYKETHAKTA